MTTFSYVAVDAQMKTVNGKTDQNTRDEVISALSKQGLRPLSIHEVASKQGLFSSNGTLSNFLKPRRVKSDHLVIMTRQLSAMIGAGVPIVRALTSLQSHAESELLRDILAEVVKDVEGGMMLGDALSKHPGSFNDIYVNMVRAGEAAGILDDILRRLAAQQEKNATIRKKVRSAMMYPMVLTGITVLAFFGLMLFVIPQIGGIMSDLGGPDAELPVITQIMLGISTAMTTYWFIIIPAFLGLVVFLTRFSRTPKGKRIVDGLLLKIPGIKTIVTKLAVARFARTFSALMGAGVAVLEALAVTSRAVGNSYFSDVIAGGASDVKNGKALSEVIAASPLFPPIVSQMLAVGEETGQTDTVLVKVAEFYEEEVDVAIDGLSAIIEPIMIVGLGGMVGLIAASVMSPIAGLAQSVK